MHRQANVNPPNADSNGKPGKAAPTGHGPGGMPKALRQGGAALIVVLIFGGLIQLGHASLPPHLFPSLQEVGLELKNILTSQLGQIFITFIRFIASLLGATLVGWLLGLMMGAFRNSVGLFASPLLSILQATPAVSWVLVAIIWMSNVDARVLFICFMVGAPLYAIHVYEGVRDIDVDLVEATEQFRPSRWQVIRILLVPQSLVALLVSMRAVSSLVLRILVFAELIGASTGIGARMADAQTNFQMAAIFAWTVIMIFVNFLIVILIDMAEKRLIGWRREAVVR